MSSLRLQPNSFPLFFKKKKKEREGIKQTLMGNELNGGVGVTLEVKDLCS